MLGKLICCRENRRQPVEFRSLEVDQVAADIWLLAACPSRNVFDGTSAMAPRFRPVGNMRRSVMPVLLLWAVPAVIVVGGVGYYLVRAVH
jgi:hypothetical protein